MEMQTVLTLSEIINLCCRNFSLPQRLKTWTLLQIYPFLLSFPLQLKNLQKHLSLKIHQADLADSTHQTFCVLFIFQRDLLVHIPPQKGKTVQTTTFSSLWKPSPSVSIKSTNFDYKMMPSFLLSILSNNFAADLEKIWIRNFIYVIFHILYTGFLPVFPLYDKGILPVTHQLHTLSWFW